MTFIPEVDLGATSDELTEVNGRDFRLK